MRPSLTSWLTSTAVTSGRRTRSGGLTGGGMDLQTGEFEAESAAYLVSGRIGIENPSEEYLAGYLGRTRKSPTSASMPGDEGGGADRADGAGTDEAEGRRGSERHGESTTWRQDVSCHQSFRQH